MGKLQKSKDKKAALLKASLVLINEGGIQGASMSKVAKIANVSPATIYLYFESKQDLVNQLYLEIKERFSQKAFNGYESGIGVKKGFELIWNNIADFKINYLPESSFLSQCDNTPMIDTESRQKGLLHLQPLLDLWEVGKKEGIIKDVSPYLLYAYTIYPMAFLLNTQYCENLVMDENKLKQAFLLAWDSIKKQVLLREKEQENKL